jgi:hypothetical protein
LSEGGPLQLALRRWAFALVPAAGLLELGAHEVQVHSVVSDDEWMGARVAVDAGWKPGDLVVFEPEWADPLGRHFFGDRLAGVPNEARPDETRFARAFEVSMRGFHAPALASWAPKEVRKVGPFTITTLENPSPAHLQDDLLSHASPDGMRVSSVDGAAESPCRWTHGPTTAGGLGSGPSVPGDRFTCEGGSFLGVTVIRDLSDAPRRCFSAPPAGGTRALRVTFSNVLFGGALHGHAGIQNENERNRTGAPVTLTWRANGRVLGKVVHHDGDGWKGFELGTTDLAGQRGELVAEVASSERARQYCFEADTR